MIFEVKEEGRDVNRRGMRGPMRSKWCEPLVPCPRAGKGVREKKSIASF
jgi:hypothetical protein